MRWWMFFLLAITVLTLQSTLAGELAVFGARPDWLLIVVIFFALFARGPQAVVGAWTIGLAADLLTIERFGLLSFTYTLTAALVVAVRAVVFRRQLATQLTITLSVTWLIQISWLVYRRLLYAPVMPLWQELTVGLIWAPVYTTIWAIPLFPALTRLGPYFGLPRARYSFSGSRSAERDHV